MPVYITLFLFLSKGKNELASFYTKVGQRDSTIMYIVLKQGWIEL